MLVFDHLLRFLLRFRYPVSLPQDVAHGLGLEISNYVTFDQFVSLLTSPAFRPTTLAKFMPRERAEAAFGKANCKERFKRSSLYSYYFSEGWLEFALEFDEESRLRRLYLHHKKIQSERGVEICLVRDVNFSPAATLALK